MNGQTKPIEKHVSTFIAGSAIAGLLAIFDYFTGSDISFILYYLIPVVYVVWRSDIIWGAVTAFECLILWLIVNYLAPNPAHLDKTIVLIWGIFEKIIFMGFMMYLVVQTKQSLELQKRLAKTDYQTGLGNRRSLAGYLLSRIEKPSGPFCICIFDFDDYEGMTVQFGQSFCDEMVKLSAKIIRKMYPVSFRFGEDKFSVIFNEASSTSAYQKMTDLEMLIKQTIHEKKNVRVTFSVGLVFCPNPRTVNQQMIMQEINHLMKEIKTDGGNKMRHRIMS